MPVEWQLYWHPYQSDRISVRAHPDYIKVSATAAFPNEWGKQPAEAEPPIKLKAQQAVPRLHAEGEAVGDNDKLTVGTTY